MLTRDPESGLLCGGRPVGWGPPKGTSASPSTALRNRYGLLLREEIAATVGDVAQIDDEIQHPLRRPRRLNRHGAAL